MECPELKEDVVRQICSRLPCRLDRARMAEACPSWNRAISEDRNLLKTLPVQYFPQSIPPSLSCISCVNGCHLLLPQAVLTSRLIGSSDDGWLAVASGPNLRHFLCDTKQDRWLKMPDHMRFSGDGDQFIVVVDAITISSTPSPQVPIQQCFAAAIVKRIVPDLSRQVPDLMFWRLDESCGLGSQDFLLDTVKDTAEDVIHYNDQFYFLNKDEQIIVVTATKTSEGSQLDTNVWGLCIAAPAPLTAEGLNPPPPHLPVCSRYLVESRGHVLMVRRYREQNDTSYFRIFQLILNKRGRSPEEDHWRWQESNLNGRMIFVAPG